MSKKTGVVIQMKQGMNFIASSLRAAARGVVVWAASIALGLQPVLAAVPANIVYQGTLRQSGGLANGAIPIEFKIWDAPVGGSQLWTSGSVAVTVTGGLFRRQLGIDNPASFAAIDWAGITPYVEITVNGTTLSPREQLHSVPYALHAGSIPYVSPAAGGVSITNNAIVSGNLTLPAGASRIGVGMTNPAFPLDVSGTARATAFVGDGSALTGVFGTDASRVLKAGDTMTGPLVLSGGGSSLTVGGDFSAGAAGLNFTAGNLGIGLTNPAVRLDVLDASASLEQRLRTTLAGGYARLRLGNPDRDLVLSNDASSDLASLDFGGSSRLQFGTANQWFNSGNLGVGMTNPSTRLQVNGTVTATAFVGDGSALGGVFGTDTTRVLKAGDTMTGQLTLAGSTLTVQGSNFSVGGTVFAVDSGNVGIGLSDPQVSLDILKAAGNVEAQVRTLGAGGVSTLRLTNVERAFTIENSPVTDLLTMNFNGASRLQFGTANQWFNSGNVGIGVSNPAQALHVNGTVAANTYLGDGSNLTGVISTDITRVLKAGDTMTGTLNMSNVRVDLTGELGFVIGRSSITTQGGMFASSFAGDGAAITGLDAGNIGTGTLPDARLPSSMANKTFTGLTSFPGPGVWTAAGRVGVGTSSPAGKLHMSSGTVVIDGNVADSLTTTGSVGIGTSAPGEGGADSRLVVARNTDMVNNVAQIIARDTQAFGAGTGGMIQFAGAYTGSSPTTFAAIQGFKENATDGNYAGGLRFFTRANGAGGWSTGGERMRIDSAGNVGVGTGTPQAKLDVFQSGAINTTTPGLTRYGLHLTPQNNTVNTAAGITFGAGDTGSGQTAQAGIYSQFSGGYGTKMYFATTNSYATGARTRLTIDHDGNVGIGTVTPGAPLDVGGLLQVRSDNTPAALGGAHYVRGTAGAGGHLVINANNSAGANTGQLYLNYTGDPSGGGMVRIRETLFVATTGNVGVGVTNPTAKLHIAGTPGVDGLRFPDGSMMVSASLGSAGVITNAGNVLVQSDSDANGSGDINFNTGNTNRMNIYNSAAPDIIHNGASTFGIGLRIFQNVIGNSDGPKLEFYKTMTAPKSYSVGLLNGVNVDDFAISENGGIGGFGTPRLTIQAGGDVGIGTTDPQHRLDVAGAIRSTANGAVTFRSGDDVDLLDVNVANTLGLRGQGDSTRGCIAFGSSNRQLCGDATGVGIGLTDPAQMLDVNGTARIRGNITLDPANPTITSGSSYITIPNGLYVSGGTPYFANEIQARGGIHNDSAAALTITGGTSGHTYFTGAGRVGIGETSPSYKLHVAGDVYANGGWLRTSGNEGWYNNTHGGGWHMTDATWIRSYNSKQVYIDSFLRADGGIASGNVASDGGGTLRTTGTGRFGGDLRTDGNFRVQGVVTCIQNVCPPNNAIRMTPNLHLNSPAGNAVIINWDNGAAATDSVLRVGSGGSVDRMIVKGSGRVGIGMDPQPTDTLFTVNGLAQNTSGVWAVYSDRRLKKDIAPIGGALATVLKLQGVTFNWKDPQKDKELGRVRGFIAQDVEKVVPEWVQDGTDGMKRLNPTGIEATLVEAIKEQQKQIEALKAELRALKE